MSAATHIPKSLCKVFRHTANTLIYTPFSALTSSILQMSQRTASQFVQRESVFCEPIVGNPSYQGSMLCHLPVELFKRILSHLHGGFRVVLSLTCKQLAKTINLETSELCSKSQTEAYHTMLWRLRKWVPEGLQLCFKCGKYLAKDTGAYKESDWVCLCRFRL
jgi:hypothetical protein